MYGGKPMEKKRGSVKRLAVIATLIFALMVFMPVPKTILPDGFVPMAFAYYTAQYTLNEGVSAGQDFVIGMLVGMARFGVTIATLLILTLVIGLLVTVAVVALMIIPRLKGMVKRV